MRSKIARIVASALMLAALVLGGATSQAEAARSFGQLYHDGTVLRTFAVTSPLPHGGTDPLYMVTNGVSGQLGITMYGPGDREFSGGDWAVYMVTFTGAPYLLTSDEAVAMALAAGDVTVTRAADRDFRCPVQP